MMGLEKRYVELEKNKCELERRYKKKDRKTWRMAVIGQHDRREMHPMNCSNDKVRAKALMKDERKPM